MNRQFIKTYLQQMTHKDLKAISKYFGITTSNNKTNLISNLLKGGAAQLSEFTQDQKVILARIISDLNELKTQSANHLLDAPITQLNQILRPEQTVRDDALQLQALQMPALERIPSAALLSFDQIDDRHERRQLSDSDHLFYSKVTIESIGNLPSNERGSDMITLPSMQLQGIKITIHDKIIRQQKKELFTTLLLKNDPTFYMENNIYVPNGITENDNLITSQYEITRISPDRKFHIVRLRHCIVSILPNKVLFIIINNIFNACFVLYELDCHVQSLTMDTIIRGSTWGSAPHIYLISDYSQTINRSYNIVLLEFLNMVIVPHIINYLGNPVTTYLSGVITEQATIILEQLRKNLIPYLEQTYDPLEINQFYNTKFKPILANATHAINVAATEYAEAAAAEQQRRQAAIDARKQGNQA